MEATIQTKFELRERVYTVARGRIHIGSITHIKAEISHILEQSEWKYYYDIQISENDGLWNVPERAVFKTREEAYAFLHKK